MGNQSKERGAANVPPLTLDMPLNGEDLQYHIDESNALIRTIRSIPDDPKIPAELARKIALYTDLQFHVGELLASAAAEASDLAADRKVEYIKIKSRLHGMTVKETEDEAELQVYKWKIAEGRAKASLKRWEALHENCEQRANACKKQLEVLIANFNGNGRAGG